MATCQSPLLKAAFPSALQDSAFSTSFSDGLLESGRQEGVSDEVAKMPCRRHTTRSCLGAGTGGSERRIRTWDAWPSHLAGEW